MFFFFFFFLQRIEIYTVCRFFFCFFFNGEGGWNRRGSVARGSVARVSELFLQIIQVSKKKKQVSSS